jgi:dynactin 1
MALCRKLTKRLDDLIQDSSALKPTLMPQLKSLSVMVPEFVNFGISVRAPELFFVAVFWDD